MTTHTVSTSPVAQIASDAVLLALCVWTWIAPLGPQPAFYYFLCIALLLDLMTRGPLLLATAMARGEGGIRIVAVLAVIAIVAASLWLFAKGAGQGWLWAVLMTALFGWRLYAVERALRRPGASVPAFVLEQLLALLALFVLVVATSNITLPDFGRAWPSPIAMGFANDDPDQWIASPPRVLFAGCVYYAWLIALRIAASRFGSTITATTKGRITGPRRLG